MSWKSRPLFKQNKTPLWTGEHRNSSIGGLLRFLQPKRVRLRSETKVMNIGRRASARAGGPSAAMCNCVVCDNVLCSCNTFACVLFLHLLDSSSGYNYCCAHCRVQCSPSPSTSWQNVLLWSKMSANCHELPAPGSQHCRQAHIDTSLLTLFLKS